MPTPEELKSADAPLNDLDLADAPISNKKESIGKRYGKSLLGAGKGFISGLEQKGGGLMGTEGYAGFGALNTAAGAGAGALEYLAGIPRSIIETLGYGMGLQKEPPQQNLAQAIMPTEQLGAFLMNPSTERAGPATLETILNVLSGRGVLKPLTPKTIGRTVAKTGTEILPRMEFPAIKEYDAAAVEARVQANLETMRNARLSTQEQIKNLAEEQGLAYKGPFEGPTKKKTAEIRADEHVIQDPVTTSSFGTKSPDDFMKDWIEHRRVNGWDINGNRLDAGNPQNTIQRLVQAIDEAVPLRGEQKKLYSEELSKRSARVAAAGKNVYGERGLFAQLSELKGQLPKKSFEAIRAKFSDAEIDGLFAGIEDTPTLLPFEKVNSKIGLQKLLEGAVPTEGEINLLRETFPKEVIDAVLERRPLFQKLKENIGEILNLPRAILASVDLSAPFRQGIFMMGRPKQFGQSFGSMFKYFGSEKAYHGLIESIKTRPTYLDMKRGGLALTETGGSLLKREERFMSQLAEKIPVFGRVARASNRAYTGFLDKLRADVFDDILAKTKTLGIEPTDDLLRSMGDFINAGTGRGKFGLAETGIIPKSMQNAAVAMNGVFFSPRLMASRLNLLNPYFYAQMNPFVRKEAFKTLLGTAGIWGTTYGLWKLNGGDVGVDPRSADFGKLKVGNTRYDILGGFQQYVRLASQLISGESVSSTTGRTITLGEGYKPLTRKDILIRFFENKESPIASFITGMLSGTDASGQRFDVPSEVVGRLVPMMVQDLYELSQEKGAEGLLGGLPAVFGVGVQTYGKQELKRGENVIGEPAIGVGPIDDLAHKIRELVIGKLPIRQSAGSSVDVYYDQLNQLPLEEKQQIFQEIAQNNPDLAKRILDVGKRRLFGITIKDEDLKTKGISSGERALAIKRQLDKLPNPEDKTKLINEYIAKGIIDSKVLLQINGLHARELSK